MWVTLASSHLHPTLNRGSFVLPSYASAVATYLELSHPRRLAEHMQGPLA